MRAAWAPHGRRMGAAWAPHGHGVRACVRCAHVRRVPRPDTGRVRTRAVEDQPDGARRPAAVAASGSRYMEIVTLVQTDFYICGLGGVVLRVDEGGVAQRDLLLLAYVCEPQDEARSP